MNRLEALGQQLLIDQWNGMKERLEKLGQFAVRPHDGYGIFSLVRKDDRVPAGQLAYAITPVVFQVPERASGAPNMFIVVSGRIYLDEEALRARKVLKTMNFGTEVGYFRHKRVQLVHCYGAHYDFSFDEVGHPIFHAQLRSFTSHSAAVSENYEGVTGELLDHMEGVLRNVRVPTAQMDFFAVVLQIAADHLLSKEASNDQKLVFEELRLLSKAIEGAGNRWPELEQAGGCMRARHWYPDKARLGIAA